MKCFLSIVLTFSIVFAVVFSFSFDSSADTYIPPEYFQFMSKSNDFSTSFFNIFRSSSLPLSSSQNYFYVNSSGDPQAVMYRYIASAVDISPYSSFFVPGSSFDYTFSFILTGLSSLSDFNSIDFLSLPFSIIFQEGSFNPNGSVNVLNYTTVSNSFVTSVGLVSDNTYRINCTGSFLLPTLSYSPSTLFCFIDTLPVSTRSAVRYSYQLTGFSLSSSDPPAVPDNYDYITLSSDHVSANFKPSAQSVNTWDSVIADHVPVSNSGSSDDYDGVILGGDLQFHTIEDSQVVYHPYSLTDNQVYTGYFEGSFATSNSDSYTFDPSLVVPHIVISKTYDFQTSTGDYIDISDVVSFDDFWIKWVRSPVPDDVTQQNFFYASFYFKLPVNFTQAYGADYDFVGLFLDFEPAILYYSGFDIHSNLTYFEIRGGKYAPAPDITGSPNYSDIEGISGGSLTPIIPGDSGVVLGSGDMEDYLLGSVSSEIGSFNDLLNDLDPWLYFSQGFGFIRGIFGLWDIDWLHYLLIISLTVGFSAFLVNLIPSVISRHK